MTIVSGSPSEQTQEVLKALQDAVTKELQKKRKLGQYVVTWQDGRPVLTGDDAPPNQSF